MGILFTLNPTQGQLNSLGKSKCDHWRNGMNAQNFFNICNEVISETSAAVASNSKPLQKITSFGTAPDDSVSEDEFLDDSTGEDEFLDDFMEDQIEPMGETEATTAQCSSADSKTICSVTVNLVQAPERKTLYDQFVWKLTHSYLLDSGNPVEQWNARYNTDIKDEDELLQAVVEEQYALSLAGVDPTECRLSSAEIASGCIDVLSVQMLALIDKLQDAGVPADRIRGILLTMKVLKPDVAQKFAFGDEFDYKELVKYSDSSDSVLAYWYLKSNGAFSVDVFEEAAELSHDYKSIIEYCTSSGAKILTLLDGCAAEVKVQVKQAIDDGTVDVDFLERFKDNKHLPVLITARSRGFSSTVIESAIEAGDAPDWFIQEYGHGCYRGVEFSEDLLFSLVKDVVVKTKLPKSILSHEEYLKSIVELYHKHQLTKTTMMQMLYLLSTDSGIEFDLRGFKSVNHWMLNRIVDDLGSSLPLSPTIGQAVIVVNEQGKVAFSDVYAFYADYDGEMKRLRNRRVDVCTLKHDAGILIVDSGMFDKAQMLRSCLLVGQSSVERWAAVNGVAKYEPERYNLDELITGLKSVPDGLRQLMECSLHKYWRVDRCIGYVLDKLPDMRYLFEYSDTNVLLQSMVPLICIDKAEEFAWKALVSIMKKVARVNSAVDRGSEGIEWVEVSSIKRSARVSFVNFCKGFSGFVEELKAAGGVSLILSGNILRITIN